MPVESWLQLALTAGIGPVLIKRLIDAAGSAEAACGATVAMLREIEGVGASRADKIAAALRSAGEMVFAELDRARAAGARIICREDESYPALLREIPDPPPVLYCRGTLEPRDLHAIAIVGSRKCSLYGREQAERFGSLLAGAGLTIISGGARGVDSSAHRGAMQHPAGRTIAVLGCGVDVVYPPENQSLFDEITQRGAILSEYPMGTPPVAENFPRRNRLISGLSRGVLVIEADLRSGALITARQAVDDHGRPVFALPGRVDNPAAAGPHKLIRDGAILVTDLQDVLDGLGPLPHSVGEASLFDQCPAPPSRDAEAPPPMLELSQEQRAIVAALADGELDADSIIERSGQPAPTVMRELTMLTLRGVIRRADANRYSTRR